MNNAIKILIVLLCLPLLGLGLTAMFSPLSVVEKVAVQPQGTHGLNTIRADIAGLLLGTVLMMVLGLLRRNTTWFLAAAVMMGVVAFGRLVGFAMDGLSTPAIPPFAVEVLIVSVMLVAHRRFTSNPEH